jgi:HK97 family phage major capsid protein
MENTEIKEFAEKLKSQIKDDFTKEIETKAEKSEIENVTNEIKDVKTILENQSTIIKSLKKEDSQVSFKDNLIEVIEKYKNENVKGRKNGMQEMKAVATILSSTNITGRIPQYDLQSGINKIPRNLLNLLSFINVGGTNSNVVSWYEEVAGEGVADYTAEGIKKNQADFDWKENSVKVVKLSVFSKVSDEMLSDIDFMQSEINDRLGYALSNKVEYELLFGDKAVTTTLNGVTSYAQPLDNAGLADTVPTEANMWDCLFAAIQQIRYEGKSNANAIFINPLDMFKLYAASKDANAAYTVVPFMTGDGLSIGGVPILTNDNIEVDHFLVGDFTKFYLKVRNENSIIGKTEDDLITNLTTLIKEGRMASYVMANDVNCFVYDDFTAAKAFLLQP